MMHRWFLSLIFLSTITFAQQAQESHGAADFPNYQEVNSSKLYSSDESYQKRVNEDYHYLLELEILPKDVKERPKKDSSFAGLEPMYGFSTKEIKQIKTYAHLARLLMRSLDETFDYFKDSYKNGVDLRNLDKNKVAGAHLVKVLKRETNNDFDQLTRIESIAASLQIVGGDKLIKDIAVAVRNSGDAELQRQYSSFKANRDKATLVQLTQTFYDGYSWYKEDFLKNVWLSDALVIDK